MLTTIISRNLTCELALADETELVSPSLTDSQLTSPPFKQSSPSSWAGPVLASLQRPLQPATCWP